MCGKVINSGGERNTVRLDVERGMGKCILKWPKYTRSSFILLP